MNIQTGKKRRLSGFLLTFTLIIGASFMIMAVAFYFFSHSMVKRNLHQVFKIIIFCLLVKNI